MVFANEALSDLLVIDLTRVLGGPYCTQILGDHAAHVIKIEPPHGDDVRDWGPPFLNDQKDMASYFVGANRNKQALALDLTQQAGRDVLLRLLEKADILIENYKIGTLEKWGIGYDEVLAKRFPKLIHCRISGFGAEGPYGGLPGYDAVAQALSGMMSINGEADGPPLRLGVPIVDLAAGLYGAIAILMAVHERKRSGQGQSMDISLYDTAVSLLHPQGINYLVGGQPQKRMGSAHPNIAPYSSFATKTVPIFIGCGNDRQFVKFCTMIKAQDLLDDARFKTNPDRVKNRQALTEALEQHLSTWDGEQLSIDLLKAGIPAGAILPVDEVLNHAQTKEAGMIVQKGDYTGIGTPIKFSRTPGSVKSPPPNFGQDTVEVLSSCGFSKEEIDDLIQQSIVITKRK